MRLFSNLALSIGLFTALSSPALADDIYMALPETIPGDPTPVVQLTKNTFEGLDPGDRFTLLNARNGRSVVTLTVPEQGRYKFAKYLNQDFAKEIGLMRTFIRTGAQLGESQKDYESDILGILAAIGTMREGRDETAHVFIVAKALQTTRPEQFSMRDSSGEVLVPSDELLLGSKLQSPYGIGLESASLSNVNVHLCVAVPTISAHERDEIKRIWAHYVSLRGGRLVSFSEDGNVCVLRFNERPTSPLDVRPLDHNTLPAMIAADMSGEVTRVTIESTEALEVERKAHRKTKQQAQERSEELARVKAERDRANKARDAAREDARKARQKKQPPKGNPLPAQEIFGAKDDLDGVTVFTRFTTIDHPHLRGVPVTTGVQYTRESFPDYVTSWCYFMRNNARGSSVQLDLGKKHKGKPLEFLPPDNRVLRDVGMTRRDFFAAQQSCRFPD